MTNRASVRREARIAAAPTTCGRWSATRPAWPCGSPASEADARGFERARTEWDSELFGVDVHVRSLVRDGWLCSTYGPGTAHDGTEGERYDLADDPLQPVDRWDDPARAVRDDLVADLRASEPPAHEPRPLV